MAETTVVSFRVDEETKQKIAEISEKLQLSGRDFVEFLIKSAELAVQEKENDFGSNIKEMFMLTNRIFEVYKHTTEQARTFISEAEKKAEEKAKEAEAKIKELEAEITALKDALKKAEEEVNKAVAEKEEAIRKAEEAERKAKEAEKKAEVLEKSYLLLENVYEILRVKEQQQQAGQE